MMAPAHWVIGGLTALALVGSAWRREPAARTHTVSIKGFAFSPPRLAVAVGDTVGFVNGDLVVHTVTGDTARWDSGDLAAGRRWKVVTKSKGRLEYHCELHPTMKGTIVVE